MFQIQRATRHAAKIKLALAGCSGSGKTYSALQLAKGIVGGDLSKVCVIDTENHSSELYAEEGQFAVVDFQPPYSPLRYLEVLGYVENEGFEVIIIDSLSHEWDGEGGCLEMQDKAGGRFQDWAKITPLHRRLFDGIRRSQAHIICTMRKKTDYAIDASGGKPKAVKVGLKDVQRDGADYEFDLVLDLDYVHYCQASKDRTGLFAGKSPFIITPETGYQLVQWAGGDSEEANSSAAPQAKHSQTASLFSGRQEAHKSLLRGVVEELGVAQDLDVTRRRELVQYLTSQRIPAEHDALLQALRSYLKVHDQAS